VPRRSRRRRFRPDAVVLDIGLPVPASPLREQFLASLDGEVEAVVADSAAAIRAALPAADCLVVDDSIADFGPEDVAEAAERRDGVCQLAVVLRVGAGA
jgi:hypothetical protein